MTVCVPSLLTWKPPNQSAQRSSRTPSTRISYLPGRPGPLTTARLLAWQPAPGQVQAAAAEAAGRARPGGAHRVRRAELPSSRRERAACHHATATLAFSTRNAVGKRERRLAWVWRGGVQLPPRRRPGGAPPPPPPPRPALSPARWGGARAGRGVPPAARPARPA